MKALFVLLLLASWAATQLIAQEAEIVPPSDVQPSQETDIVPPSDVQPPQEKEILPPSDAQPAQETGTVPPTEALPPQKTDVLPPSDVQPAQETGTVPTPEAMPPHETEILPTPGVPGPTDAQPAPETEPLPPPDVMPPQEMKILPTPGIPRRWSLELPMTFPEGIGANLGYRWLDWLAADVFYHVPVLIRVHATIKSKKLVDREGITIRSPNIDLPARVELGPHMGLSARFEPFKHALFLTLGLEHRVLKIESTVQSHLEVADAYSRNLTNTLFQASARTRTDQTLLRSTFGYRWLLGDDTYFFSLFSGLSRPLRARSHVRTEVRVRNPEASNPANVDAQNLSEAEAQQSKLMQQKLEGELRKFEKLTLPILGISFGKYL